MGQGASRDAIRRAPKEEYYDGATGKAYYADSQRKNGTATGAVAAFIDPIDEIPVKLIFDLQKKHPLRRYKDFALTRIVYTDEAMVWINDSGSTAILCLVGLNIAQNNQHLLDDLNIAGFTQGDACDLRLKTVAENAISVIKSYGVPNIICIGYSLGGATTACVAGLVTRTIILNGGAPATNAPRLTPPNCTCYHIVGDVLSTHWTVAKRIYLDEVKPNPNLALTDRYFQVDAVRWTDVAYYHDMDRFMDFGSPYKIVDAQFEQNSLVNYLFYNKDETNFTSGLAGGVSSSFNFVSKVKEIACRNPVPGASVGEACGNVDTAGQIAGGVVGGIIGGVGGALAGGAGVGAGAAAGAGIGSRVLSGQTGLIDELAPDLAAKIDKAGTFATDYARDYAKELQASNTGDGQFTGKVQDNAVQPRDPYRDGMVPRNI